MSELESMQKDRVVVVTGAAGGIGSEFVGRFLKNGDTVIGMDINAEALDKLPAKWNANPKLHTILGDITKEEECGRIADFARTRAGRVDILINCAGYYPDQPFEQMTLDQWKQVIDINLTGNFLMTHFMLPLMKGRGWGRIVSISSASIFAGVPGQTHYIAAKAGVIGFVRSLAREVGDYGITVNAVTPGLTLTDPVRKNMQAFIPLQPAQRALKRDEQAGDLVGAVFFLASPDSDFITGQIINVDGGKVMH